VSPDRIFLIAEAGVNHNGSLELALQLVDAAAGCGADAVKFQTFRADKLASRPAPKAKYQQQTTGSAESQLDMLRRLELGREEHIALAARCHERGIEFLSTPFDLESLTLLVDTLAVRALKIGSGDLTNGPLLHAAAGTGKPLLVSTGMATLLEVEAALALIAHGLTRGSETPDADAVRAAYAGAAGRDALTAGVTLLQCTTDYPAEFADLNLKAMQRLADAFGTRVGFSDHSTGIAAAVAAAALGARVIEKHLTLDRTLPGPDHLASLEPREWSLLTQSVREVERALGDGDKRPTRTELENAVAARKSLATALPVRKGEPFTASNLTVLRPGNGVSPMQYWIWLGRKAERDYAAGDLIEP
jgi:N-acetylneuraminate synthase